MTPQEGCGHWELTRIRDDLFVIVTNFTYHDLRTELVPGDGMVQFNWMDSLYWPLGPSMLLIRDLSREVCDLGEYWMRLKKRVADPSFKRTHESVQDAAMKAVAALDDSGIPEE